MADHRARATAQSQGAAPRSAWAALVPELLVTDIDVAVAFWCGVLGFAIAFSRPAAKFAYLEREAAQIMLCERNGRWETGAMHPPLGQGVSFQIEVTHVDAVLRSLEDAGYPLYESPADVWYRVGDSELGQREFLVQDPDGYLLRFAQEIGRRPGSVTVAPA